jgi:hypothetical protein
VSKKIVSDDEPAGKWLQDPFGSRIQIEVLLKPLDLGSLAFLAG